MSVIRGTITTIIVLWIMCWSIILLPKIIDNLSNPKPKILMLCSAPGQDCEPYIQPQPFTGYNN